MADRGWCAKDGEPTNQTSETAMQGYAIPAFWKVLVVDDNFENRDTLALILEFFKAEVTQAESGPEALQVLDQQGEINLCLLDIMMPGSSGWQVLAEIRNHPNATIRALPVIAVTVLSTAQERRELLDSGFDGHLVKP